MTQENFRNGEHFTVQAVETLSQVARDFKMLRLVFAHRDEVRLIQQDICSHGISRGSGYTCNEVDFTDDEEHGQLVLPLAEEIVIFAFSIDGNSCIEGMTDEVIPAGCFEDARQVAAQGQELIPACFQIGIEVFFMSLRPIGEQYAFFLAFALRHGPYQAG